MPNVRSRRRGAPTLFLTSALLVGTAVLSPAPAAAADETLDRLLIDPRIRESSGLARSNFDRGTLFTHNDSGGEARVFAVAPNGYTQSSIDLQGARFRDWEDISSGPGRSMWVGDIGDNRRARDTIQVYRFTEPESLDTDAVSTTRYDLRYPDGSHNAEGLMVHPSSGRLYIVTKATSGAGIYEAPSNLSTSGVNTLRRVAGAPSLVKGAAFSPDGSTFVLTGGGINYVYRSIGGNPTTVQKPPLRQGESVTISRDGSSMMLGSEGRQSPVYRVPMP